MSLLVAALGVALAGVESTPAPRNLEARTEPRRVAFIVGLDTYDVDPNLHNLSYAAADAEAVAALLQEQGYDVHTLTGRGGREAFWERYAEATGGLGGDDLFLLYFAGHAQLQPAASDDALHLLFSGDRSDAVSPGVPVQAVSAALSELPAQQRVVILDTCYSERSQQLIAQTRGGAVTVRLPEVGRYEAWIYAAAPHQSAQEDPELGHGVFTWYLLKGLGGEADANGDGLVVLLELYSWVGYQTAQHTQMAQVPHLVEDRIGWLDLTLSAVEGGEGGGMAIVPWYAELLPQAEIYLDGLLRGPGGVEPGRHRVEIVDGGEVLLRRTLWLQEGEALPWEHLLHTLEPRAFVSLGGSLNLSDGDLPFGAPQLGVWAQPRARRAWRWSFGGLAQGGLSAPSEGVEVPVVLAEARMGWWWQSVGSWSLGPILGAGAALRWPVRGVESAPMFHPGAHAHWERERWMISAELGVVSLPVGGWGTWVVAPSGALGVGVRL